MIVVAGHICLDLIPAFLGASEVAPGSLTEVGAATVATGGAVANVGQALHRLGAPVRLVANVGDDLFGEGIRRILDSNGLAGDLGVRAGEATSYTVVIDPPGSDRAFLHAPGCNASFGAMDVPDAMLAPGVHFHFGYPPLMRRISANHGAELTALFRRAKTRGCTTSLDMSLPDPTSASGQIDWARVLSGVLPFVDVFAPSAAELAFFFRSTDPGSADPAHLLELARRSRSLGAKTVVVKAGDRGLVVHDKSEAFWVPAYAVEVVGATGAGDAAIAGLVFALRQELDLRAAARFAAAVGALACEAPDAVGGVPTAETARTRQAKLQPKDPELGAGWKYDSGVYVPVSGRPSLQA